MEEQKDELIVCRYRVSTAPSLPFRDGVLVLGVLPLPENLRQGKTLTDLEFWVRKED